MTRHLPGLLVVLSCMITSGTSASAIEWKAPGPNIAQGKPYQLLKNPNYGLTKDDGDKTQLTDGQFAPTEKPIWFFKETVGWSGFVTPIIVDLGSDQSIGGVGFRADVSQISGVGWPPAVLVFVSTDGKDYYYSGEIISTSSKFGVAKDHVGPYFFRTDEITTHGRYVQFVALTSMFTFTDEIEVYQGKPEYLTAPYAGEAIVDPQEYTKQHKMAFAMAARLATDTGRAARLIQSLNIKPELAAQLDAQLEALRVAALKPDLAVQYDIDYRALAPLTPVHAQTFALLSQAYRAAGCPEYSIWHNNRWNRQSAFTLPTALVDGNLPEVKLDVKLLQNDRRGEVINLGNFTDAEKSAVVSVSGLPGGSQPKYLRVHEAEYIAMQSQVWDADVLPLAPATGAGWTVKLPAGLSRQIWLDFNVDAQDCPVGTHQGTIDIQVQGGPKLSVPITLTVAPYRLPNHNEKAVAVGVWDYTDNEGTGGLIMSDKKPGATFNNLDAVVKFLRESGISAPWGQANYYPTGTFPHPGRGVEAFDKDGNFIEGSLDFKNFDRWVALWPDAKYYMIYTIAWWNYAGAVKDVHGAAEVQRRIGVVMTKWAEHMRSKGIDPKKIVLLLADEPIHTAACDLTNLWAEAIKKSVPEFKIFVDPMLGPKMFGNPSVEKMFEYADIITPGTDYSYHHHGQVAVDYYEGWRKKGKIMGFYACAQNPSEGECVRYFRLQQWACWLISGGAPESWAGFWAFCDVRGIKPWNQLAGSELDRNWCQAYLDTKGATDGKHWLAIFEGVNDYEYLLMLKKRIAECEKAGTHSEAVAAAKKVLDEVPAQVIAKVREGDPVDAKVREGDFAAACDEGRLRVLDALTSLAGDK